MSSYDRPYYESQRGHREPPFARRRSGRREDEDFERGGFREARSREAYSYAPRSWREREFEPDFSSHYEGEFGRGRFDELEDWERPRELPQQQGYRRQFGGFGSSRYETRGRYAGRGPKGYQRSDERLKEEVCDRLTADPDIDASEIEVSVENGEVTLGGTIADRHMKRDTEDCVEAIPGVHQVHNRIRIEARPETDERHGMSGVSRFWRGAH